MRNALFERNIVQSLVIGNFSSVSPVAVSAATCWLLSACAGSVAVFGRPHVRLIDGCVCAHARSPGLCHWKHATHYDPQRGALCGDVCSRDLTNELQHFLTLEVFTGFLMVVVTLDDSSVRLSTATATVFKLSWPTVIEHSACTCTCEMQVALELQCSSFTAFFELWAVRFLTWWVSERKVAASARGSCPTLVGEKVHFETWCAPAVQDQFSCGNAVKVLRSHSQCARRVLVSPCCCARPPSWLSLVPHTMEVLDWVSTDDWKRFLTLIQERITTWYHPGNLRTSSLRVPFIEDSDDGRVRVWVTLADIQPRRRRRILINAGTLRVRIQ